MKLTSDKLAQRLEQRLDPIYLIFGDDPFLRQQQSDRIRQAARAQGFAERIRLTQDKDFAWSELQQAGQTMSLFASQQLIELELPEGKPGAEGGKALQQFAAQQSPDQILLLQGPRLRREQQSSRWFKKLSEVGCFVPLYTPDRTQLPAFIQTQARQYQVELSSDAVQQLADWYQGNLLALDQEIHKLSLLFPGQSIDSATITQVTQRQSRYDVFALRDALLAGDLARCLQTLARLKELGEEPVLIAWVLQKHQWVLQTLHAPPPDLNFRQFWAAEKLWPALQDQYQAAARHWTTVLNQQSLHLLRRLELALKRDSGEDVFTLCAHLCHLYLLAPDEQNLPAVLTAEVVDHE